MISFLPEVARPPNMRLGRHIEHDERSRSYRVVRARQPIASVRHLRRIPPLDQGDVGACTGFAGVGMMCTGPHLHDDLGAQDAIALYSEASLLDDIPGEYPPSDTGSSGLAVCKALLLRGWIRSYSHAFSLDDVLNGLQSGPGITGIVWRESCDSPNSLGVVRYQGAALGGHEFEIVGFDATEGLIWFCNSWGADWGAGGYFAMHLDDYARALADAGDATFAEPIG